MNLHEDINRMKQMMGLNEDTTPFELFGITEQLVGYEPGPFALYAHLFSKLYKSYKKGNLEKEYALLMSNEDVNKKMVNYFYDFIIDNDEYFQEQEKGVFTEQVIEDVEKNNRVDLSSKMEKLFESYIQKNKDIICSIEIIAPWNRETIEPDKSFQHYEVSITFIGGYGTKYWPRTMAVLDIYDDISNMVWDRIYNFFNEAVDIYTKAVPTCPTIEKEEETEGVGAYAAPAFEMKPDHVHFKHEYNEGEITERCWKGYTQKGMKTMFGKRYPNCVKIKK